MPAAVILCNYVVLISLGVRLLEFTQDLNLRLKIRAGIKNKLHKSQFPAQFYAAP